jgi:hypothetical protein
MSQSKGSDSTKRNLAPERDQEKLERFSGSIPRQHNELEQGADSTKRNLALAAGAAAVAVENPSPAIAAAAKISDVANCVGP